MPTVLTHWSKVLRVSFGSQVPNLAIIGTDVGSCRSKNDKPGTWLGDGGLCRCGSPTW